METVCCLAGDEDLLGKGNSETKSLQRAVENRDNGFLFEWLMEAFSLQGVSDQAALTYIQRHGNPKWHELEQTLIEARCPKLRRYWSFHQCGYRKEASTCSEPTLLMHCPLPTIQLRNGRLNQTAYALFLFIRDIADRDLVSWINKRLEQTHRGRIRGHADRMVDALIAPMRHIFGVSDKVLNMTLAWLLIAAPVGKRFWRETGVRMIAVDTLVHNFFHRTGILRRLDAEHVYGPSCYQSNGCAEIILRVATHIDAGEFNQNYPKVFPRFVQHAIWRYCAQSGLNICQGNRIDDRFRCEGRGCPLSSCCDRVALRVTDPSPRNPARRGRGV